MKTTRVFAVLLGVLVLVAAVLMVLPGGKPVPEGLPTEAPSGEDWIDLLDEAHAAGWENVSDERDIFAIERGVLHIPGTFGRLRYVGFTPEVFGDFDLHLEFRVAPRANSGVFLRVPVEESEHRGFEVQVLDDHGKPPTANRSGSIYDVVTPMHNLSRPAGEWNSYDITVNGARVTVRMNGWLVIDADFSLMTKPLGKFKVPYAEMPAEGRITLQDHGGEVWYRNIRVRRR